MRSGAVKLEGQHTAPGLGLPASAQEDQDWKAYIPSLYVVCTGSETIPLLPQPAQDLLGDYTGDQAVENGEVN